MPNAVPCNNQLHRARSPSPFLLSFREGPSLHLLAERTQAPVRTTASFPPIGRASGSAPKRSGRGDLINGGGEENRCAMTTRRPEIFGGRTQECSLQSRMLGVAIAQSGAQSTDSKYYCCPSLRQGLSKRTGLAASHFPSFLSPDVPS